MLDKFADNVFQFNEIAGNNTKVSIQDFKAQQKCLIEEVNEISEGLANSNLEKVLDGVVDVLYVAIGMLIKLEELGIDTEVALQRIGENNLSKFPEYSKEISDKTFEQYKLQGVNLVENLAFTANYPNGIMVFTDDNSKIRKPYGFSSVTLNDLVEGIEFK